MRLFFSFMLVLLTGIMVYLYFTMPFLKPSISTYAEMDVRIIRGSFLLTPVFSSLIVVLIWAVESSLASLVIRRSVRGAERSQINLGVIMSEFSLGYFPEFIFLLIIVPLVWFNLPEYTVTSVEGLINASKSLGESPLYVNGMLALIAVSISRYPIYAAILRYRLDIGWRETLTIIALLIIVDTLIALWGGGFRLR